MKNIDVNTRRKLNLLLSEELVVQKTLGMANDVCDGERILYGETYDKYGITID